MHSRRYRSSSEAGLALAAAALVLLGATASHAYVYHDYRWEGFPVIWYLDESSEDVSGIPTAELEAVLEEAFATWARAEYADTCTSIWMEYGGQVDAQGILIDGLSVVSFQADPGYPGDPHSHAMTVPVYRDNILEEADLVLHVRPDAPLAIDPGSDEFDLLGIVIHELGHFFGLDHTDVPAATMYGTFPPSGDISWQTLETDDLQGMTSLYPLACGDPCTVEPDDCGEDEICNPLTERCYPFEECAPVVGPRSGCSLAGAGALPALRWAILVLVCAAVYAFMRRR
jgi:hypothetical protein